MGTAKALLPVDDRPAVRLCAERLLSAAVSELVVVTGAYAEEVRAALTGLAVRFCHNDAAASEMADSVRIALPAVSLSATAVLVSLADHPLVQTATIRTLVASHAASPHAIVIPVFQGRNGHPTLFPRPVLQEIEDLPTLRDVIRKDRQRGMKVQVEDEGVILDMDTPEEYRRMMGRQSDHSATSVNRTETEIFPSSSGQGSESI